MGNKTSDELWPAQERLRFVEQAAYWRGWVRRQDLLSGFGISLAQASADLQKYQEMNPGALVYNLNKKRYEASPEMRCVRGGARLEEAIARFLPGGNAVASAGLLAEAFEQPRESDQRSAEFERTGLREEPRSYRGALADADAVGEADADDAEVGRALPAGIVDVLRLPTRRSSREVERRVFLAVLGRQRVEVLYHSVNSGETRWRWLQPHAFAHNGSRWHVRAWCETHSEYRDFTLSRIEEARWPVALETKPESAPQRPDIQWEEWAVLTLVPNPRLDEGKRRAVLHDYDLPPEGRRIRVRRAMENYLRSRLHLPLRGEETVMPLVAILEDKLEMRESP